MGGCCKSGNKKDQDRNQQQQQEFVNESAECMPKIPPDELCREEQKREFTMRYACGAYLTRRFIQKSPDDAIFDALYALDDLMDFWEECADDPEYYNTSMYQDPCQERVIRAKMNKECRKRVACEPVCLPPRQNPQ